MSYDDRQIDKPLVICMKCGNWYYMASALCAWCGDGWRDKQHVPEPRIDVSGNLLDGP